MPHFLYGFACNAVISPHLRGIMCSRYLSLVSTVLACIPLWCYDGRVIVCPTDLHSTYMRSMEAAIYSGKHRRLRALLRPLFRTFRALILSYRNVRRAPRSFRAGGFILPELLVGVAVFFCLGRGNCGPCTRTGTLLPYWQ